MGKSDKLNKAIQEYISMERNKRSNELFGKPEASLELGELSLLNEYMHDLNHPQWKLIMYENTPTVYMINNVGEVYNVVEGKIETLTIDDSGHEIIHITPNKDSESCKLYIHNLVAEAFIPNTDDKKQVVFKYNKTVNWVGNLEWNTPEDNETTNFNKNISSWRYSESDVHKICKLLQDGVVPYTVAKAFNMPSGTLWNIQNGKTWRHISSQYNIPSSASIKEKRKSNKDNGKSKK